MKRLSIFIPFLLFFALILISVFWWKEVSRPVSNSTVLKNFIIAKGDNAQVVGNKLYENGLIRNSLAFKFYTQITSKSKSLLAGEYQLSPSLSLEEIVRELENGPVEVWVTIPEGLRREEIASRFIKDLSISDPEKANTFLEEFLSASSGKEGYLFPDTYLFPHTTTASNIVTKMTSTFDSKTASLNNDLSKGNSQSNLSWNEVIILASILERETKTESERPIVAGILEKRLTNGWPLQTDASVQYGISNLNCKKSINCDWWPMPTKANLALDNPYNTYLNKGLPPTPISNPGLSSINAVIHPQASDFWYYLHDSKGNIHYAITLEEQDANITKYLGS